jgi:hypothetical protein
MAEPNLFPPDHKKEEPLKIVFFKVRTVKCEKDDVLNRFPSMPSCHQKRFVLRRTRLEAKIANLIGIIVPNLAI